MQRLLLISFRCHVLRNITNQMISYQLFYIVLNHYSDVARCLCYAQVVNGRLLSVRLVESHCLHIGDEAAARDSAMALRTHVPFFCLKVIDIAEISIQLRGAVPLPCRSGIEYGSATVVSEHKPAWWNSCGRL